MLERGRNLLPPALRLLLRAAVATAFCPAADAAVAAAPRAPQDAPDASDATVATATDGPAVWRHAGKRVELPVHTPQQHVHVRRVVQRAHRLAMQRNVRMLPGAAVATTESATEPASTEPTAAVAQSAAAVSESAPESAASEPESAASVAESATECSAAQPAAAVSARAAADAGLVLELAQRRRKVRGDVWTPRTEL